MLAPPLFSSFLNSNIEMRNETPAPLAVRLLARRGEYDLYLSIEYNIYIAHIGVAPVLNYPFVDLNIHMKVYTVINRSPSPSGSSHAEARTIIYIFIYIYIYIYTYIYTYVYIYIYINIPD